MCSNWLKELWGQSENLLKSSGGVRTRDGRGCHEPPPHFVLTEANSQGYTRTFTRTIHCSTLAYRPEKCWRARRPGINWWGKDFHGPQGKKSKREKITDTPSKSIWAEQHCENLGEGVAGGFRGERHEKGSVPDFQMSILDERGRCYAITILVSRMTALGIFV